MDTEHRYNETTREKVVRLKVDGASTAVNTLRDQQTARGISLICPFPALEVDIPVRFGHGRKTDMTMGSIHRISVEDDAETGLPRLRLSIRARDPKCATVSPETPARAPESSTRAPEPEVGNLGLIQLTNIKSIPDLMQEDTLPSVPVPKIIEAPAVTLPGIPPAAGGDRVEHQFTAVGRMEPAWVDCDDVPPPEEFLKNRAAGRGYRIAAKAGAWLVVFGLIVAGGYIMERTGFVDISKFRSYVAGFSVNGSHEARGNAVKSPLVDGDALAELQKETVALIEETEGQGELAPNPAAAEQMRPTASLSAIPVSGEIRETTLETGTPEMDVSKEKEVQDAKTDTPPEKILTENDVEVGNANEVEILLSDVTLVLPTRWPVEYASAYRIRDPNGIVVDVPGGLVRREGWLESGTEHPMIRSIKAIQRETGARYVVYVHGTLPRFVTSPKTEGVSLRLYHETDEATSTEQIAMAN